MSDDGKCYAATPATTLEEHILNSNIAKSDTEWWAHHEITRLRADLAAVTEERDRMRTLLTRLYAAAGPLDADKMLADDFAQIITIVLDARAALEGVTEPAKGDSNA